LQIKYLSTVQHYKWAFTFRYQLSEAEKL
jgi:hypothetical protein